jgi:hypothetical protein
MLMSQQPVSKLPSSAFVYLDPFSGPGISLEPYTPRLKLTGAVATVGLMSNLFVDASHLLEDLKAPLARLIPGVKFVFYDKGQMRNSSFPAPARQIEQIAHECDAVICAYGHCGSCTGGTVHDAVAFARAGLPVVALVTKKFMDEARFLARAGGIPDTPFVFMPHPIAGRDAGFQQAVALAIAPAIIEALTGGRTTNAADCLESTAYAAHFDAASGVAA